VKYLGALCAVAVVLVMAGVSRASSVSYTVDGLAPTQFPAATTPPADATWGVNGYPGDTVALESYAGTLDLTPGSYVQKINTLDWTIDYTYGGTATDSSESAWTDQSFNLALARHMSFGGGPATSISQTGLLVSTWDNDYLTVNDGGSAVFTVAGYRIVVTPLGVDTTPGSNFDGDNPWVQPQQDVMARFDVTALPLPTAASVGMTMLGGLGVLVAMRKRLTPKTQVA